MCLFKNRLLVSTTALWQNLKISIDAQKFQETITYLAEIILRQQEQKTYKKALKSLDTLEEILKITGTSVTKKIALEGRRIMILQQLSLDCPKDVLRRYKGIAKYAQTVQNYEISLQYYQLCLQQWNKLSIPDFREKSTLLLALSNLSRDMKKMDYAVKYAKESITVLADNNIQPTYLQYMDLALKTNNIKDKERWLLKSYTLCQQGVGYYHFDTARRAEALADFYKQTQKVVNSKKYYEQSIDILHTINRFNRYNFFINLITNKITTLPQLGRQAC